MLEKQKQIPSNLKYQSLNSDELTSIQMLVLTSWDHWED